LFEALRIGPDRVERKRDRNLIPGAEMMTAENAGHFLPLDRPDKVIEQFKTFARC
jgi:pimeloyl-ACP methyl ester carboxylesterase